MAPSAVYQHAAPIPTFNKNDILKVRDAPYAYRNDTWEKPVADDYMYAFKYNFPLPTHDENSNVLDFTQDDEQCLQAIAVRNLKQLEQVIQSRDSKAFAKLFLDSGKLNGAACFLGITTDSIRCVERQAYFHVGLSFIQHPSEH